MCEFCAMSKTGIRNGRRWCPMCVSETLARRLSLAGSTWHWIVSKFTIKNVQRKFLASRCGVNLCNDKNETCFAYICAMRLGAVAFVFHWVLFFRHVRRCVGRFASTNRPNSIWSKWSSSKRATCECMTQQWNRSSAEPEVIMHFVRIFGSERMEFAETELEKEFPYPLTTSFSLVILFAGNSNPILEKKKKTIMCCFRSKCRHTHIAPSRIRIHLNVNSFDGALDVNQTSPNMYLQNSRQYASCIHNTEETFYLRVRFPCRRWLGVYFCA